MGEGFPGIEVFELINPFNKKFWIFNTWSDQTRTEMLISNRTCVLSVIEQSGEFFGKKKLSFSPL